MRHARIAVALLLAGALGCTGAGARPDEMDISNEESVDVPGGPNSLANNALNPMNAGSGLNQELSSSLKNQGVSEGDVNRITLKQLRLEVTAPLRNGSPAQDLRFLDTLTMTVKTDSLPELLVAKSLPLKDMSTQSQSFGTMVYAVDIPPEAGVDMKDYAIAESMTVTVAVTANSRPAFSCTVKVTTVLHVELNPVGAASNRLPVPGM